MEDAAVGKWQTQSDRSGEPLLKGEKTYTSKAKCCKIEKSKLSEADRGRVELTYIKGESLLTRGAEKRSRVQLRGKGRKKGWSNLCKRRAKNYSPATQKGTS